MRFALGLEATGIPAPLVSTLNYAAGQTPRNNTVAALGTAGQISVLCSPSGTTHVVLDVNGYFEQVRLTPSASLVHAPGRPLAQGRPFVGQAATSLGAAALLPAELALHESRPRSMTSRTPWEMMRSTPPALLKRASRTRSRRLPSSVESRTTSWRS